MQAVGVAKPNPSDSTLREGIIVISFIRFTLILTLLLVFVTRSGGSAETCVIWGWFVY